MDPEDDPELDYRPPRRPVTCVDRCCGGCEWCKPGIESEDDDNEEPPRL